MHELRTCVEVVKTKNTWFLLFHNNPRKVEKLIQVKPIILLCSVLFQTAQTGGRGGPRRQRGHQPVSHRQSLQQRVDAMSTVQLRAVVQRMIAIDPVMASLVVDETPEHALLRPAPGHPPPGLWTP